MRLRNLALGALLMFGAGSAVAQTGAQSGTKFGSGADSIRCITNISLYEPYAKNRNYADALPYWEIAYNECPAASLNLYINGVRIVEWQIANEKNPAKRKELIDKLMGVYDNRMKYFGNNRAYPTTRLVGMKASAYLRLMGKDADKKMAYDWLTESVSAFEGGSQPEIIKDWLWTMDGMFRDNQDLRSDYIEVYLKGIDYLDQYIANNDSVKGAYAAQVKDATTQLFATSGAADCASMQDLFGPQVVENKDNLDYLKKTISLFRRSRCTETDAYFAASEYAHKIQPTMESAQGMANQAVKKEQYQQAISFYKEALGYADNDADRADLDMNIAKLYFKTKNYQLSRDHIRKSLAVKKSPEGYILVAMMYAHSRSEERRVGKEC